MTIWNTRIKIQYISDLHLEYKKFYNLLKTNVKILKMFFLFLEIMIYI